MINRFCAAAVAAAACTGALAENRLEEVRVVARRNLLDEAVMPAISTQQITVLDQVSLNRTVADWIERLPGVSLNGQGGLLQSYSVRGFSRWRLRTELDGVPIITDRRAGNAASFVPPDLIGVSTVQRGPASALYGSGAMGGVVGLSTLHTDGVLLRGASQTGDRQRSLTVAGGETGRYGAALSIRRADEGEDARGNALNSGFEQLAGLLKVEREWRGHEVDLSWLPSLSEDVGKSNAFYPDRRISDYPESLHSVAQARIRDDDRWLLQLYHHYQDWQSDTERVASRRNETEYSGHTIGGLFYRRQSLLGGDGRWGLEWVGRRDVTIEEAEFGPDGSKVFQRDVVDGRQDDLAVFADQSWRRGDFDVGAGLRYDYVDQSQDGDGSSDSQLNASLRSAWTGPDRWTLALELGTGFRFPTLTERFFDGTTPRGDIRGNPDLEPERNSAIEFAAEYLGDRFELRGTAYYNALEDYIERYAVSEDLVSYRNLDEARIYGYELALGWESGRMHHELSYQWQRGTDKDGNWLADLNPPDLRYLLRWKGDAVSVRTDLSYRLSRDEAGPGEQPLDSALVWNASASRPLGNGWSVELYAYNLLDEYYLGSADDAAAHQPGRTLGVRLEWRVGGPGG